MSGLIISVSGLRGIVGETLTPEVASRYVAAFATEIPPGPIVVARDGRATGAMLRDTIVGTLAACGRDVIDCGVAATPTVGVFVRESGAAGAVQISASHNPPEYNGIKLFGGDGRVVGAAAGGQVAERYRANQPRWARYSELGTVARVGDPHSGHLEAVLRTVDVQRIRGRRFRVLIDSNHGAGSLLGTRLLEDLGCEVVVMGGVPDGQFAHPPEPTRENLVTVGQRVVTTGCDLGFCQDPDADRLALVDSSGHYIGEEYTLALCVLRRLMDVPESATEPPPTVVINCATSGMTEWLAARSRVRCVRSAVGEANVADRMIAEGAIYGGEGNGGPIDPRVGYVRDSFVGMAQILDLLALSNRTLSDFVSEIPQLSIVKSKTTLAAEHLPRIFDLLEARMEAPAADRLDGLRLAWEGRWLLVRGSNTEPIVRLIAEAGSDEDAQHLCNQAAAIIEEATA
ncbi:phosphoglucosamine mutase [Candidatus Laterigemmans baculatus]|uniref:phosphoglucosamine mutase n=1 Tax=Candidatus Laterigemmans baculatus TaxID=2770505 RepID=UPI0013DD4F3C|nr:phosphoglucosamine mutase [Candidatus Laterigemmans baculatus]